MNEEQMQNRKKIIDEEIGQDIFLDELFDLIKCKDLNVDIWKDPEIVAFLQANNLPPIDLDFDFSLLPKNMPFEWYLRLGLKLGKMEEALEKVLSSGLKLQHFVRNKKKNLIKYHGRRKSDG